MGGITKSLWTLFTGAVVGTPDSNDIIPFAPQPGVALTTELKGATVGSIVSGAGGVVGPAVATDNAVARYDGTTGKLIQNSAAIVTDTGEVQSDAVTVPGTSGHTVKWSADVAAPGTTVGPFVPGPFYGGAGNMLGDPTKWVIVNIAGVEYKIPAY